jgi:hypothetical protein
MHDSICESLQCYNGYQNNHFSYHIFGQNSYKKIRFIPNIVFLNFSVEMLSDEQVASLMMEDLDEDPLLGLPVGQTIQASSRPPSALSKAA